MDTNSFAPNHLLGQSRGSFEVSPSSKLTELLKPRERGKSSDASKRANGGSRDEQASTFVRPKSRFRHVVEDGETLESIAEEKLGDARFSQLIITINRAEIIYTFIGGTSVAAVYAGQNLLMPSEEELEIHKRHFFSAAAKQQQQAKVQKSAPKTQNFQPLSVFIEPPSVADSDRTETASPEQPFPEVAKLKRFHYEVRLGETLQTIAAKDPVMRDHQLWQLIARINGLSIEVDILGRPVARLTRGQFLALPTNNEIEHFKLLNKLMKIAELAGKPDEAKELAAKQQWYTTLQPDRTEVVERLSSFCRMVVSIDSDAKYSISLQADIDGEWLTVAAYECLQAQSVRATYRQNKSVNYLNVSLPSAVAQQMGMEDFRRNWHFYYSRFMAV